METEEFEKWVKIEKLKVEIYIKEEGIENPNVGPWPAFEVAPYFAIWPVESEKAKGKIGWWAFSGDCPTDYVSEDGKCNPKNALQNLIIKWKLYVPLLKIGKPPVNTKLGNNSNRKLLGKLLEKRIKILENYLNNKEIWEER